MATFENVNFRSLMGNNIQSALIADQKRSFPGSQSRPISTKAAYGSTGFPSALGLTDVFMNVGLITSTAVAQESAISHLNPLLEVAAAKAGGAKEQTVRDLYQEVWAGYVTSDVLKSLNDMSDEDFKKIFDTDKALPNMGDQTSGSTSETPSTQSGSSGSSSSSGTSSSGSGTPSPQAPSPGDNWGKFARMFLEQLGYPRTQENVDALLTWMLREQPPDSPNGAYNPLNIQTGDVPHIGVTDHGQYIFSNIVQGTSSTADFLTADQYHFYDAVRAALEAGNDATAVLVAIQESPWASSHYGYTLVNSLATVQADRATYENGRLV